MLAISPSGRGLRFAAIGAPKLAKIEDPQAQLGYKPVSIPMPTPQPS